MITFTIGKNGYFIDDDFNVVVGKNKDFIQKDIDLFFMGFYPSFGDPVLIYKERLENMFGASIKDFSSIKMAFGTIDCSDYHKENTKITNDTLLGKIKNMFK